MRELTLVELDMVAGGGDDRPPTVTLPDIEVVAARKEDDGGWYVSIGLGLGAGFVLTFSGSGIDASVGAGLFGIFKVGHADNDEDLETDEAFGNVKAGPVEVGLEYDMNGNVVKAQLGLITVDSTGQVGLNVPMAGDWSYDVNADPEVGLQGGVGILWSLNHRDWLQSEQGGPGGGIGGGNEQVHQ